MLGWSGSGFFERESHHLLIARRVPRNWGQQDRNCSRPQSTVICAGAGWLSQPPRDRAIKAGFEPDAGRWDQSMEPQIKHCENGAGDCTEEVSEVVKSLEQPSCLSNANAISRKVFCSAASEC